MKSNIEDLAIFGAEPAFKEKLHVGRPNIGNRKRFLERVNDILDKRWLTNAGPYVRELERALADFLSMRHCIAMCNGTMAMENVVRAIGLTGEVIVPAFTFISTAHALQWQEITPVFCDVDPRTHNIDPSQIERMITPRTTGIIGAHLWGRPCDIEALTEIAQRHALRLLFDAAHAFGCSYKGRMIGGFGDAEVFSFHATKFFNTMEGGAVATDNDELAAKLRLMKNFGFTSYDEVSYIGINGKMTEVCAAMGLTGMESLEEFIGINRRNYHFYRHELEGLAGVRFLTNDEREKHNYQYIVLEIDKSITGISRDQLVKILHTENVLARRYFFPGCHKMEPYRSYFPHADLLLPNTERLVERVLSLPTGIAIGKREIGEICQIVRLVIENSHEVREMEMGRARKSRTQ
jgi:dTDP-4-amino-4,6-dideoxygalactose transaminase